MALGHQSFVFTKVRTFWRECWECHPENVPLIGPKIPMGFGTLAGAVAFISEFFGGQSFWIGCHSQHFQKGTFQFSWHSDGAETRKSDNTEAVNITFYYML
jgi:hypothetical protein